MQHTPFTIPIIIASLCMLLPLIYIMRTRRSIPGKTTFLVMLGATIIWTISYNLELASGSLAAKYFWSRFKYLGVATVPVTWLVFAIFYSGHTIKRSTVAMLSVMPLISLLAAWTNSWHWLFYSSFELDHAGPFITAIKGHGPFYWMNAIYTYSLLIAGTSIIIRTFIHADPIYRRQTGLVLIGVLTPLLGNISYNLGLSIIPNQDQTPLLFLVSGAILSYTLIRYQLFNVLPVAYSTIIQNLNDGIIVQDDSQRVMSINPAAQRILNCGSGELIGRQINDLTSWDLSQQLLTLNEGHAEIELEVEGKPLVFDQQNVPLYDKRGKINGQITVLHDITDRIRAAKLLKESEERFRLLSLTDGLTSLFNARHFHEQLAREFSRARRYGHDLSLLLLDIDDFKRFNDNWGHLEGDQVLMTMGECLKTILRQSDTAYRYGGEEFTVLLPATPGENAFYAALRLRDCFNNHPYHPGSNQEVFMSASIGIANLRPDDNLKTFLNRADQNMYLAKRAGKDRICEDDGTIIDPANLPTDR